MNKKCELIKLEDLLRKMNDLSQIYDIVRVVDPKDTKVLHFEDGKIIKEELESCFSVWEKHERCDNCISNQACSEKKRMTKFEFRQEEAYYVLSVPYLMIDNGQEYLIALELVNKVTSDFRMNTNRIDQTADLIHAIHLQTYADTLTGTYNRKYFDEKRYLFDSMNNFQNRLGFFMIDVNQFKSVNDLYGHIHGDELLAKIGEVLRSCFRNSDKVIRIGGDEFLIVVRDCNRRFMEESIGKVKRAVSGISFSWMGQCRPSIAVGMAYTNVFTGSDEQIEELYSSADKDMYRDKRAPFPETYEKSILDEASILITVIDIENHEVLYSNKKANELYKNSLGRKCYDVFYNNTKPCEHCILAASKKEVVESILEYNGRNYRQVLKMIEWNGRQALLKCMEDITEQKELQQYAEQEKDTLKRIVQNVPAGLFVFKMDQDHQLSIVEANPSACTLMGIDFHKTIGSGTQQIFELTHPEDRPLIAEVIKKIATPGQVVPYEYRQFNKAKNEYCWLSAMAHSILEKDGSISIYISYFDITEQKKSQKLKEDLRIAKIESQAKTDFMSNMSHDMRTPLNGMLGLAYLMKSKKDIAELHNDADQLIVSGKLLLSLINDTLDINKIESGNFKLNLRPMNSAMIFQNVITTVAITAKQAGIELLYDIPDIPKEKWIPVIADSTRVEQILINIITNAIKYSNEGGTVELHMTTVSITEDTVTDQYVIKDHGIGMSSDFLPHLFEPFVQEGRTNTVRAQGSGLGMSIVKQLVDLMGGTIKVESTLNEGTTVTLVMNYAVFKGELQEHRTEENDIHELKGMNVLLCEDHPLNQQIVIHLLEKQGVTVDVADNGKIGIEKLMQAETGFYDLILMDIRMPVMDGITATKAIRKLDRPDAKSIPILAMTANAFAEDISETTQAGMNEHLAKPVEPAKLYKTLSKYYKS